MSSPHLPPHDGSPDHDESITAWVDPQDYLGSGDDPGAFEEEPEDLHGFDRGRAPGREGDQRAALHDPRAMGPTQRRRRSWMLLLGTLLVPGSAHLATGRRRVGRIALTVTLVVWALLLLTVVLGLLWRTPLIFVLTNGLTTPVIIAALMLLGIGWALLLFDTLRLIRPGLLEGRTRPAVIISTVLAMIVTSGGLFYGAHLLNVTRSTVNDIFAGGFPFRPVDGRYNILLMGADAGEDRVGLRPDSMTVVSIDARSGQTVTISLPRNLQNVPFPNDSPLHEVYPEGYDCGNECILNAVYTDVTQNHVDVYGNKVEDPGAQAMMDAATGALGIEVQGYAMIDMAGFEQLIDALGGITIDVGGRVPIGGGHDQFTGAPNPIEGYIEPGVQNLDGFHALWYARSREGASDYDRQARQRCVQQAMLAQLNPLNVVTKFEDLAAAGTQVVITDIPQSSIGSFVDLAGQAKDHPLIGYAAGPPFYDSMFPTYPDYDQLHADVADLLEQADGKQEVRIPHTGDAAQASGVSVAGGPAGSMSVARLPGATVQISADEGSGTELSPNGTCSVP